MFPTNILQKVLYYSGFIFSCYAFIFISWQNQAYKFHRFKFHASFFRRTGMARIQIITAVTLDGYLPDPNEELLQWVKTDSQGFPFWHERSTFTLFPGYPMLDLICEKDEKPDSFTFTSEISDPKSLDLLHGLSIYHLIDEIIIYILPLTTGNGTDCLHRLPVNRWKLYRTVAFKNGIVRLIYRKSSR